MATGRFYSLKDYPCPDEDEQGNLIVYDDGGQDDCDDPEVVVVVPEGNGWREVL